MNRKRQGNEGNMVTTFQSPSPQTPIFLHHIPPLRYSLDPAGGSLYNGPGYITKEVGL